MKNNISNLPILEDCKITIVGLGYVGLPLAIEFAKKNICLRTGKNISREIVGFDIDKNRIEQLKIGIDYTNEVFEEDIEILSKIKLTSQEKLIYDSDVYIVTVPTPIDRFKKPDLTLIKKASILLGKCIRERFDKFSDEKNFSSAIIIFESTVYPTLTEDICAKIIEENSNLEYNKDFFCGYSPERINPGDKNYRLTDIIKVTSGSTPEVANWVDELYGSIIDSGTYKSRSIAIAEAAKVIENTQRDVNIALINEFAIIFKKMGLDTLDILEAASTKWNFLNFKPGLVGGHCIGVDPYYLTYKSEELGYSPQIVLSGRRINDSMANWIVDQVILEMCKRKLLISKAEILILGLTFKENCPDLRNTKIKDIINICKNYDLNLTLVDPNINEVQAENNFSEKFNKEIPFDKKYSVILYLVAHDQFKIIDHKKLNSILIKNGFIFDLKGFLPKNSNTIRI